MPTTPHLHLEGHLVATAETFVGDVEHRVLDARRAVREGSFHQGTPTCNRPATGRAQCPQGHAYDEANTYVDPRGYRMCRTCRRDGEARRRARRAKNPPLSPEQRSMSARAAAYARHAQHDPRPFAAKATAAFLARFEQQVDPERRLDPEERRKRALAARKAYFARLQLASSRARSKHRTRRR
jgi:hypothetical protein